jgi:2-polyprenyl-3-methyl-5-hydroxy-6-metoxy-1,4-benzoquinol methylase
VPVVATALVNIWERLLDCVALAAIAGIVAVMSGRGSTMTLVLVTGVAGTMLPTVRRIGLRAAAMVVRSVARMAGHDERPEIGRLAGGDTWLVALSASVAAWVLPGLAFWGLVGVWGYPFGLGHAQEAYASSTLAGGIVFAPGGIVVAGGRLLTTLGQAGVPGSLAALSVVGIRLATAGLSTVLGGVFLLVHLRSAPGESDHFDLIADAYDVQIAEGRRLALVTRKTELMRAVMAGHQVGRRGLDVGCGQGWYVARMRDLGFDVTGIDGSAGQVQLACRNVGRRDLISVGSALDIPAADSTYDFAYTINVVHHLPSVNHQRSAFAELMRVLKPGGLLFLHEINTRNLLFRFYMGYVFPTVNCIDEGVERWLLPDRLAQYTDVPIVDIRYFTFLPDFFPQALVRFFHPLERRLEASFLGSYAAHYMAVLRKPG